jgi:hypothetical protein
MKTLLTIVVLTLMGAPAFAQTSADDRPLFSVGPSETPCDAVIVEDKVKHPEQDSNFGLRPSDDAG